MRNVSQTIYRCASLVMLGCFIGCGGELTTIARPVQKVTGTITVKGKAEPDVIVTMHPVGGDAAIPGFVVSRGRTDASGAFQISLTYRNLWKWSRSRNNLLNRSLSRKLPKVCNNDERISSLNSSHGLTAMVMVKCDTAKYHKHFPHSVSGDLITIQTWFWIAMNC